jgi:hypothetical protein
LYIYLYAYDNGINPTDRHVISLFQTPVLKNINSQDELHFNSQPIQFDSFELDDTLLFGVITDITADVKEYVSVTNEIEGNIILRREASLGKYYFELIHANNIGPFKLNSNSWTIAFVLKLIDYEKPYGILINQPDFIIEYNYDELNDLSKFGLICPYLLQRNSLGLKDSYEHIDGNDIYTSPYFIFVVSLDVQYRRAFSTIIYRNSETNSVKTIKRYTDSSLSLYSAGVDPFNATEFNITPLINDTVSAPHIYEYIHVDQYMSSYIDNTIDDTLPLNTLIPGINTSSYERLIYYLENKYDNS